MVRLSALTALLVMLAVLQGAGLLFPREDRAKGLCDDRFRLKSAVPADGRSDIATPAEAARLLRDYSDRLVPCRTVELEDASKAHSELVAIVAGSYVRRDDNLLRLVTGRIAWKAWRDEDAAIAAWAQSRAGLFHDRLKSGSVGHYFREIRRAAGGESVAARLGRAPACPAAAAIGDPPHGQDPAHDVFV